MRAPPPAYFREFLVGVGLACALVLWNALPVARQVFVYQGY